MHVGVQVTERFGQGTRRQFPEVRKEQLKSSLLCKTQLMLSKREGCAAATIDGICRGEQLSPSVWPTPPLFLPSILGKDPDDFTSSDDFSVPYTTPHETAYALVCAHQGAADTIWSAVRASRDGVEEEEVSEREYQSPPSTSCMTAAACHRRSQHNRILARRAHSTC